LCFLHIKLASGIGLAAGAFFKPGFQPSLE
jgi:hypothetical protein